MSRLFQTAATTVAVVVVVFIFTHQIGDPIRIMYPDAPAEMIDALRARLGLDRPLYVQFADYVVNAARLDFGTSLRTGVPNLELIMSRLPATAQLAVVSMTLATIAGVVLGTVAALAPGSKIDRAVMASTTFLVTALDFWVALLLISVVSVRLGWLPTSGYGDLKHIVLPAVVIAIAPTGRIAQITRPAIISELSKQYVVALRARGISEVRIVAIHAGRNAAIVIATIVGHEFAATLNGSVIIETIFAWPGVGFLLIEAINGRDWPLITSTTIFVVVVVLLLNLVVDLLYAWLDPRVQYR